MRAARPTIFAVAVVAVAVLAGAVAYVLTAHRQDQAAATAAIGAAGVSSTATPRPMGSTPPCACFAAATPAAPTPTTGVIQPHGVAEPDSGKAASQPAQAQQAARRVAARVLRTAFTFDTRADDSTDAAAQRARRWLAPGGLHAVGAATAAVATRWHEWAAHQASARVTLAPVGSVHMNGTTTAQMTFRVTVRMHGEKGWHEQTQRRVTVRCVHRDGRWRVDRLHLTAAAG